MGFQDFLDKYEVTGVDPGFVSKMDSGVGPALTAAWATGNPVVGTLGAALAMPPGGLVIMPFLEADLSIALAAILAGTPVAPAVILPLTPIALKTLIALNPLAPEKATAIANAMLDWACAQAPPVAPVPKGPPAPWPPPFIAV
jgi:hypothetical protein